MPEEQLFLKEIDALSKIVEDFTKTKSIFEDLEDRFPTQAILNKQKIEPTKVEVDTTPTTETLKVMDDPLLDVNKELLEVTTNDVVGSIEELTKTIENSVKPIQVPGMEVSLDSEDFASKMLKSIQSIEQGDAFTKQPEFLQFMEENEARAKELIKGTEEDRALGFETLTAIEMLRESNKESIDALLMEQEKANKKRFRDVAKDFAGKFPGFGSIKGIGLEKLIEGALIAGIGGWEVGKVLENWMNDNWQIRDKFASAMDAIVETFPTASEWLGIASTKLDLGKQVLSPAEQEKNIRIQARKELIKEYDQRIKQIQDRVDIDDASKAELIKNKEAQILKLQQQVGELATIDIGKVTEPDSPLVLEKIKEIGKRERAMQAMSPGLGTTQNIGGELDNRVHKVFREEVIRGRKPVQSQQPQTTVLPIPTPTPPRPAPQKQIDDFGTPMMHLFLQ